MLQEGVVEAIQSPVKAEDTLVPPKLLGWDLLAIAYSDERFDDAEQRLLRTIMRKLGIDKTVYLELESSLLTLLDLERELQWIKTTDRPYLTIEATVNEIENRKSAILESVRDLINL